MTLFAALKVPEVQKKVTLEFKLMNWNFLNFELELPTDTNLFVVKQKIEARHGRIRDLVVCRGVYAEENELRDDMKTLEDYGIRGSADGKAREMILYEFKPRDHQREDPLLLHLTSLQY